MDSQVKNGWRWLYALLLILVVPNIIFWITAPMVTQERGIFVLEYFVIACFFPFIPGGLFKTIWVLFVIYDLFIATSSLFFMDFLEIGHALAQIPSLPFTDILKWAGLLLLLVLVILALLKLMIRYNSSFSFLRFRFMWPLIVLTGAMLFFTDRKLSKRNIVSAPTWPFIKAVQHAIAKSREKHDIEYLGSVAQKIFTPVPDTLQSKKEVLILVEAWGLLNNKALQDEILQPFYAPGQNKRYAVREGATQYKYLTQAGEFRELTGYLFHYYQVRDKWVKENSLLIKKQEQGYHVIGMHGNTSGFYRRHIIWPVLGVQEMYFLEDFEKMSMPLCGNSSFRGVCDTAINTWLLRNVQKQPDRKEFYYWVTLNTHLPVVEVHDEFFRRFAEKWKKEGVSENVLQLAYQHKLFFTDLAGKLSDPLAPALHVLLVGDHAPPFIDPPSRGFYDKTYVPYIELVPLK